MRPNGNENSRFSMLKFPGSVHVWATFGNMETRLQTKWVTQWETKRETKSETKLRTQWETNWATNWGTKRGTKSETHWETQWEAKTLGETHWETHWERHWETHWETKEETQWETELETSRWQSGGQSARQSGRQNERQSGGQARRQSEEKMEDSQKQTRNSSAPCLWISLSHRAGIHRNFWFVRVIVTWMQLAMLIFSVRSICHLETWNMHLNATTRMWHPTLVRFPFESSRHRSASRFASWVNYTSHLGYLQTLSN